MNADPQTQGNAHVPAGERSAPGMVRRRAQRVIVPALCVTVAVLAVWPWASGEWNRRRGLRWARQGNHTEAEDSLRAALRWKPNDEQILKFLALGYMGRDNLQEAGPYLQRWCAVRPNDPEPFGKRMEYWQRLGRDAEELADGQRVLELDGSDRKVRREVARLLSATGKFQEAETQCRRCLEDEPADAESLCLLGQILRDAGREEEAAKVLDRLIAERPDFARALLLRAMLHEDADRPERAIPLLRQVLALDHGMVEIAARYQLSLILARTGQAVEAKQVIESVEKERLAEALFAFGKADEAIRLLQEVLQRDPGCASAQRLLVEWNSKRGPMMQRVEAQISRFP